MPHSEKLGLVLSGGGARGAYQAGVLLAVQEISGKRFPFEVLTGVSAGAINASFLACQADDPLRGAQELANLWRTIKADHVIKTDSITFLWTLLKLAGNLVFRGFKNTAHRKPPYSILDAAPLRQLLTDKLDLDRISRNIKNGTPQAFCITATDYDNSNSISFVECQKHLSWVRKRRFGVPSKIGVEHVLASGAIPIFFSPVKIGDRFFGDGSVRNNAPLSPAIHLNASKLLIISVKKPLDVTELPVTAAPPPSPAKVFSLILNALMLDQTDFDMERLIRINHTLRAAPRLESELRPIDFIWIQPSVDLGELAKKYLKNLPRAIRYLLHPFGKLEHSSEIASYLLFDPEYCSALVEIGYRDGMSRGKEIEDFLSTRPAD